MFNFNQGPKLPLVRTLPPGSSSRRMAYQGLEQRRCRRLSLRDNPLRLTRTRGEARRPPVVPGRDAQRADHKIMIGFRTLPDGFSVLCDDPKAVEHPEVAAIVDFEPASSPAAIERRILDHFAG